jgi:hypothetical protein
MGNFDTSWLESLITTSANAYSSVKSADALKSQYAFNDNGEFPVNMQTPSAGNSTGALLLIGGAVVLFMLLKD